MGKTLAESGITAGGPSSGPWPADSSRFGRIAEGISLRSDVASGLHRHASRRGYDPDGFGPYAGLFHWRAVRP
jgi:hypothetical protein